MKKLTTVLIVMTFVGLLAVPKPAVAGVQFGLKVGGNMAKPTGADLANLDATIKNKVGFVGGIFIAFNLSNSFTIQTEVLYTMKGATLSDPVDPAVEGKLYGDYVEIPLLLKIKLFNLGIQPFIEAGAYAGFKLHEKMTVMGEEVPVTEAILKNNDYGAIVGAGLQLGHSFSIDVRYSMGLAKIAADITNPDIKNGVWSATIGLGF
jgi:hypothetical protein